MDNVVFNREKLAQAYCDSLEGRGFTDATSGLFLAGPRRVGKSTFLIQDLIPEAQGRDWLTVYVDLWSNRTIDPALLIVEAVKNTLMPYKSKLAKLAKQVQVKKVNILKLVELDFSSSGLPDNITLTELLKHLIELVGQSVLLIIDEAQHALSSSDGVAAMFSMKSARDQINIPGSNPNLMLTLTGSNRDKLAQLVIKKDQPFFGSEITSFPLLGREYTDFFTDKINQALSANNQFSKESVWEAFKLTGHRPEVLRQMVGRTALSNEAESFSALLKQDVSVWHSQMWEEFESDFNALNPLHKAILSLLIQEGKTWAPFSDESLQYYRQETAQEITASSVQKAISMLRDKGFIWQSSRGGYALEDESFAEWFKYFSDKQ